MALIIHEAAEDCFKFLISKSRDEDKNQASASEDLLQKKKKKNEKKTHKNLSQVSMAKNHEAEVSDEHSISRYEDKKPESASVSVASEDHPQKRKTTENSSQGVLVTSKNWFQRVFSGDDEIRILKGMLDYIEKTQSDPMSNIDDFSKNLKLDVTRSQLHTKMKRLKGAYKKNVLRQRTGNALNIHIPAKMEAFELSQKIWGMNINVLKSKENIDSKPEGDDAYGLKLLKKARENDDCVGMDSSALEEWIMTHKMENVGSKKKRRMEKKLRDIEMAEIELFAMKCEYKAEKLRLICDAKKASL